MNKLELIKNLKEDCQLSKKEAAAIVDLFFGKISDTLAEWGFAGMGYDGRMLESIGN